MEPSKYRLTNNKNIILETALEASSINPQNIPTYLITFWYNIGPNKQKLKIILYTHKNPIKKKKKKQRKLDNAH